MKMNVKCLILMVNVYVVKESLRINTGELP